MRFTWLNILFFLAIAAGAIFRFTGLGHKMVSHDEAYTALYAAGYNKAEVMPGIWIGAAKTAGEIRQYLQPGSERGLQYTIQTLARSEPYTTQLYYVLAHFWMRAAGDSPADMRLLSAFISLLAVPGMYWFSWELFQCRRTAILSTAILSLSPYHLLFAQDARPYSLFIAFILFSSAAVLRAIRKDRKRDWAAYALFLTAGVYTHMLFGFVALAHGSYLAINRDELRPGQLVRYIAAAALSLGALMLWLAQGLAIYDALKGGLGWSAVPVNLWRLVQGWVLIFASPFLDIHLGYKSILPYILRLPALLFLGLALIFLVIRAPRRVWSFLALMIGFGAVPLILSDLLRGGMLSISGRYFASVNTAVIPAAAYLVSTKLSEVRPRPSKVWTAVTALLFGSLILSCANYLTADTWWSKNLSPWSSPEVIRTLNDASRPVLIVYGQDPTDFGDVLAFSEMMDQDVRFVLLRFGDLAELPDGVSEIFVYHRNEAGFFRSDLGATYETQEVIPDRLYQILQQ